MPTRSVLRAMRPESPAVISISVIRVLPAPKGSSKERPVLYILQLLKGAPRVCPAREGV